jgi:hypothetical protein
LVARWKALPLEPPRNSISLIMTREEEKRKREKEGEGRGLI